MEITAENLAEVLKSSKNIILHGAPGTGKTHLAREIAKYLIDPDYDPQNPSIADDDTRIGFVQFHPSYDYTDFVEGLRPVNKNGQVVFQRKDGVFKEFCKKALLDKSFIKKSELIKENLLKFYDEKLSIFTNFDTDEKWENAPLFELAYSRLIEEIKEKGESGLKLDNKYFLGRSFLVFFNNSQIQGTFNGNRVTYSKNILSKCFADPDEYWKTTKNGSLEASIGKHMRTLVEDIDDVKISFDEFCEIFTLTQFDDELESETKNESDKEIEKENDEQNIYVFIIDEINRGEISKIFGELFYLIDPDKRGNNYKLSSQYQNLIENDDKFSDGFYIPENMYIIATMNDIDRSVEPIDFAFRRRFTWINVKADDTKDEILKGLNEIDEYLKNEAEAKMMALNKAIKELEELDENYCIGASYFLKLKDLLEETEETEETEDYSKPFKKLWEYHLLDLLREYLRGASDIESKIKELKDVYDNAKPENSSGK